MSEAITETDDLRELVVEVVHQESSYIVRRCTPNIAGLSPWYEVEMKFPHPRSVLTEATGYVPGAEDLYEAEIDNDRGSAVFFFGHGQ